MGHGRLLMPCPWFDFYGAGLTTADLSSIEHGNTGGWNPSATPVALHWADGAAWNGKQVNIAKCSASTTFSPQYACNKAYDGTGMHDNSDGWASKSEGVSAFIKLEFDQEYTLTLFKFANRPHTDNESSKRVRLEFSNGSKQTVDLERKAAGLVGYPLAAVKTNFVRIVVETVYCVGKCINNGAAKVEFWTSGGNINSQPFHDWAAAGAPTGNVAECVYLDATQNGYKTTAATDSSCAEEQMTAVSKEDCRTACLSLGSRFGEGTWAHSPGCFRVTSGTWKDNCHWNLNADAKRDNQFNRAVCSQASASVSTSLFKLAKNDCKTFGLTSVLCERPCELNDDGKCKSAVNGEQGDMTYKLGSCMPNGLYTRNACCQDGQIEIATEKECKQAYEALKGSAALNDKVAWGGNAPRVARPSGCFLHTVNNNVHFNGNTVAGNGKRLYGNDQVICMDNKAATEIGFALTPKGQLCMPGLEVTSEDECQAAARAMKKDWTKEYAGDRDHPFCVLASDGAKVHFNGHPSPGGTADSAQSVCKQDWSEWVGVYKIKYSNSNENTYAKKLRPA